MTTTGVAKVWRYLGLLAACLVLAAFLSACAGEDHDAGSGDKVLVLEAKLHSLEESIEDIQEENAALSNDLVSMQGENTALKSELASLRQEQADYVQAQEAAEAAREHEEEVADFEEGQEEQLAALEGGQARNDQRLYDMDSRLLDLETVADRVEWLLPSMQTWFENVEKRLTVLEGTSIDRTAKLAETGGGKAQVINFGAAYGADRSAVLVLPDPLPENEIPLIVSLHGFGGDSFTQSLYLPMHDRVNTDIFALLIPEGSIGPKGSRFWNLSQDSDVDDVASLTALVEETGGEFNMGALYFFGHSNGGFMAYHMACQGLPGLRAVASLAGTGSADTESCQGAAPVSVLQIHGTDDEVVRFEGRNGDITGKGGDELKSYAGALDMVSRWATHAGCDWPADPQPQATLDLDEFVSGAETHVYRSESGCAEGISIELWQGEGSAHIPGYGDAFTGALLDWLLAQN